MRRGASAFETRRGERRHHPKQGQRQGAARERSSLDFPAAFRLVPFPSRGFFESCCPSARLPIVSFHQSRAHINQSMPRNEPPACTAPAPAPVLLAPFCPPVQVVS